MEGRIRVVRSEMLKEGLPTPGMVRHFAETEDVAVSQTRTAPHTVPDWHHHGSHTAYVFVRSGTLRVEWGTDGRESVDLKPGDFYVIPPGTAHRESNPGDDEQVIWGLLVGTGPAVVNVAGPDQH